MSDLTFYTNPMSRGRIVRWMLEETGQPYDTQVLDYGTTMKAPEYLAINPMGKVPAVRHGDQVITECAAICAYLGDAFPEAGLAPEPHERARFLRWLFFVAGPVEAAVVNRSLGFETNADQEMMAGWGNYDRALATLEAAISEHPYICGERFTAADVYIGSQVGWGLQFGTFPKADAFQAYFDRVSDREAYRRGNEKDDALLPEGSQ